jgi:hypothetical protein
MRIIWPIIADSLESFDETTTTASAGIDAPKSSVALTSSDLSRFNTEYLRADRLAAERGRECRSFVVIGHIIR